MSEEQEPTWGWDGDAFQGGYAKEQEDRDELEATATPPMLLMTGALPERVDPRRHPLAGEGFLQVENQGQIGSCAGNALADCGEFCFTLATGMVLQFSRMFAYIVTQMIDGIRRDNGSTINGGTKAARDVGFCPEADAPYPSRYPGWGYVTDKMKELAAKFKLRSHSVMRSATECKQFLGSGIGIIQIGIGWNRSCEPDSSGCIRSWRSGGGGGHSVVICGYVPDSDVGQKSSCGYWFLLKNSWSKRWGVNGYAYVDPQAVDQMLADRGTVMIGRSDMGDPKPRNLPVDFTRPGESSNVW